jgi:hypothetical protein
MILGHRNVGKHIATIAIGLLIMMFVITLLLGTRKKIEPAQQPLLRPSSLIL